MEEDIKLFIEHLSKEKRCSQNTLAAYNNDINQLATYVRNRSSQELINSSIRQLSPEVLSAYSANLRERKYSLSTIARKIAAARTFLKFMEGRGRIKVDLSTHLSSPHVNKQLPKPLTISQVRILLAETGKLATIDAKRDRAMLELLYATGLRATELMTLNLDDIDLKSNKIKCLSQGAKPRAIPIDSKIRDIMKEYIDSVRIKLLSSESEPALFLNRRGGRLTRQGFWQIVQGYADRAELGVKVTPRVLRQSFAIHNFRAGADLQSIREVMGHAHISTTRVYKQASQSA